MNTTRSDLALIQATVDTIFSRSRARFGHGLFQMIGGSVLDGLPAEDDLARFRQCHTLSNSHERNDLAKEAGERAQGVFALMNTILNSGTGADGALTASESRDYRKAESVFDELSGIRNAYYVEPAQRQSLIAPARDESRYREGAPLAQAQTARGFVEAVAGRDQLLPGDVRNALEQDGREDLDFGKYLRGAFTGVWDGAEAERIMMVQSGGTDAAGGVQIPTILTADLIDLARNQTRVVQAGARVVPMTNRKIEVARWLTDPVPEWRAENDPIVEDDATLDKIELVAKSLAVVTRATRELVEDTDIGDELKAAFANSFALKLDFGALYGTGANDQPTGVKNTTGVTKTPAATNGGTIDWDVLVDAVGRLRDNNEEPNAQILSDKTARNLAKLKDGNENYMTPPSYLDGVTRYSTNQVPNNLAVGTSGATTSDVFTGDWTKLLWGVRTQLVITMLTERFMVRNVEDPDTSPGSDTGGQYGFVAWWRGDFAVARPKAFDVVTGVKFP